MSTEELRRRKAAVGAAELARERETEATIVCAGPDCEGTIFVFRDWDPAAMAPITLAANCRMCGQVWTIIEPGERIVGVRSGPAWPHRD